MKQFLINEQQLEALGKVLLEIPAKMSLPGIDILRNLQEHKQEPVNNSNEDLI